MPFYIYDVTASGASRKYSRVRRISIGGKHGPLAAMVQEMNTKGQSPFQWHVSSSQILERLSGSGASQEIVVDIDPNNKEKGTLYRLRDIWGFSEQTWTQVAVLFESIHEHKPVPDVLEFKKSFDDRDAANELRAEFLYLRGGVTGGTWNWGRHGSVNSVLLSRDAYRYFTGELGKFL